MLYSCLKTIGMRYPKHSISFQCRECVNPSKRELNRIYQNAQRSLIGNLGNRFHKTSSERCKKAGKCWIKAQSTQLLEIIRESPFQKPPPYEKLIGDLAGAYSRRINIQPRFVYQVYQLERAVKVLRFWTHHELPILRRFLTGIAACEVFLPSQE